MSSTSSFDGDARPLPGDGGAGSPGRSDVLLELAAETAQFGGWEVRLPEHEVWWSDQVYALFEIPLGTRLSLESSFALCAPEYRKQMWEIFEACAHDGEPYDTTIEAVTTSGRRIWVRTVGKAVRGEDGTIVRVQGAVQDTTQQKLLESEALGLARRLTNTLETMSEAFFTLDAGMRFTYLNRAASRMLQRQRGELVGKYIWDEFREAVGGTSYREYGRALRDQVMVAFEEYYPPLGRWFEARCYPSDDGLAVYFHDVSEAKQAQASLQKAHRALQMLSRCNQLLVRATHERELISQVCQVAVDIGGYRMAWVGYVHPDAAHSITVAAQAGMAADATWLGELALGWSPHDERGSGPAGLAIRSGKPVVIANLETDARFSAHLQPALARGFRGAVFLPMLAGSHAFALLSLLSGNEIGIDDAESQLLRELADNLAFGIQSIRARKEQENIKSAVNKVAASVSSAKGERFLEQLAAAMAQSVGADGAFISRLLPHTQPRKARTVVAVVDGERIPNVEYVVGETPCASALEHQVCVISAGLERSFPNSPAAAAGAEAYVGWRLNASGGEAMGTASVVFREPVQRSDFVTSTLRIFAARAAAELELQDADAQVRAQAALLDQAQDGIIVRDMDDRIIFWNKSAERMYGWTREEALGRQIYELLSDDIALFQEARRQTLESGHWDGEFSRQRKDGSVISVEVRLSLIRNDDGAVRAILSISTDISQRKAAAREIERLAFYDRITGLPNRILLLDRLEHALAICARSGESGALMFIDIDHFKTINDTLGHDTGDQLLGEIARRLRTCLAISDTLARFGGDEFMVMVEKLSADQREAAREATTICQRILDAVRQPILLAGVERHVSASIGVTLFSTNQCEVGELLKQTDLALYQVKSAGRNGMRFFDPAMQREITARAALEAELREAHGLDEFALHYQPQVDTQGRVIGAEALIRWNSRRRGAISPATFIPIAEESGQIVAIGAWVLESACAQLARWAGDARLRHICVSVNVSARQMRRTAFVDEILGVLEATGADPAKLKLEITESMLVEDSETTIAMMHALKAHGVVFSLDDFGTGYSSLSYLKRMPLDQLKIDQSFVRDVLEEANDAAIARTIIELARNLKMKVIAEGVETAAQREFLAAHGCREFQGYLFCRPVPAAEFEAFVRSAPAGDGPGPGTP